MDFNEVKRLTETVRIMTIKQMLVVPVFVIGFILLLNFLLKNYGRKQGLKILDKITLVIFCFLIVLWIYQKNNEYFLDFSITPRASLDIFNLPSNEPRPIDKCKHCDGLCAQEHIGKGYPPESRPLCQNHPLIKKGTGFYKIQCVDNPIKYLAYDLNSLDGEGLSLYLAEPKTEEAKNQADLVWKIDREIDIFRLSTCRQPSIYLDGGKNAELTTSYFKVGKWRLLQRRGDEILIQSKEPRYYLTPNVSKKRVILSNELHSWKLIPTSPCKNNKITEGFVNNLEFPDTPEKDDRDLSKNYGSLGDWNEHYSKFWNGEYIYKNTTSTNNDYLTVFLKPNGEGKISTKEESWRVLSMGPELLYGENNESYIYLEMLSAEKGKEYYDPNRPQIKIVKKLKHTSSKNPLISLVSKDPNNLNAYAPKVGEVGEKVSQYPHEKFTNFLSNLPTKLLMDGITPLSAKLGYQLPSADLNIMKPCLLENPTKAPVWGGYWEKIDKTGKLSKIGKFGPMEVQYSFIYQCEDGSIKESNRSPITKVPYSVGSGGYYYSAIMETYGKKGVKSIRAYVKGPGDNNFSLNTEREGKDGKIQFYVVPNIVKRTLEN